MANATDHLWMHFTRMSSYRDGEVPTIVRGEGAYVWDSQRPALPRRAGRAVRGQRRPRPHRAGRRRRQAGRRAGVLPALVVRPPDGDRAGRRGSPTLAPGDLNRVFFTTGGSEAVESAWKLARAYFKRTGKPNKHKVVSRHIAYHGTSMGALSITGLPGIKSDFEPLVPGGIKVPNTNFYRAPEHGDVAGGLRAVGGRRDRPGHRARGAGHGRGGLPGAGAELRRLLPAAARLLPAGPGDLRRVRRAARLRRGDLRLGPARRVLRRRAVRLPARHHHHRQGPHLRVRAAGRDDRDATG